MLFERYGCDVPQPPSFSSIAPWLYIPEGWQMIIESVRDFTYKSFNPVFKFVGEENGSHNEKRPVPNNYQGVFHFSECQYWFSIFSSGYALL